MTNTSLGETFSINARLLSVSPTGRSHSRCINRIKVAVVTLNAPGTVKRIDLCVMPAVSVQVCCCGSNSNPQFGQGWDGFTRVWQVEQCDKSDHTPSQFASFSSAHML